MRRLRFRCGRKKSHTTALANGKSRNKKERENAKEEIYDNSSEFSDIFLVCVLMCASVHMSVCQTETEKFKQRERERESFMRS